MKVTFEFSDDVPEAAKATLGWLVPRAIECGLGRIKMLRTSVPGFDRTKNHLDPEDRITYLFNYEDRADDLSVAVTVEQVVLQPCP